LAKIEKPKNEENRAIIRKENPARITGKRGSRTDK
jgi:hypothetical protein